MSKERDVTPLHEGPGSERLGWTLAQLKWAYTRLVLRQTGGRIEEAARILGISRRTLYNWLHHDPTHGDPGPARKFAPGG